MKKDTLIAAVVPLILIAGILYSGYTNGATGFVAAEPTKAFGTYYLDPSFKIKFDYEMESEYEDTIAKAKNAIGQCKAQKKIGECLKQYAKSEGFECDRNDLEGIFYGILSKYEECLNLKEDEAVCRLSPSREMPQEKFRKNYEILARSLIDEVSFELKDSGNDIMEDAVSSPGIYYTDFDRKETKASSVSIKLDYNGEPKIESITASDGKALSSIILYKKGNKAYFIEKSVENNFLLQKGIKKANLPRKNAAKFCIRSGKQASALESMDNEVKNRNIVYRFAVKYPELDVPPPVTNFDAADKLKAEGSAILTWGKAKWEDGSDAINSDHYNVYCSESEFKSNDNKEIDFENAASIKVFSDINPEQWKVTISKCGSKNIEDGRMHYFAITSATEEAESIATISKSVAPADDLAPGIMRFALVNGKGARVDSTDGSAFIEMSGSINAVPRAPEYNEDKDNSRQGTRIKDEEKLEYLLHYSKTKVAGSMDVCEQKKCRIIGLNQPTSFSINDDIENEKFAEGGIYYFTLVARDEQKNAIKSIVSPYEFAAPEQWRGLENFRIGQ